MLSTLTSLDKEVTIISDDHNRKLYQDIIEESYKNEYISKTVNVLSASEISQSKLEFDLVLATERAGRAKDGK